MYVAEQSWKRALLTGLAIVGAPILGLNALLAFNTYTNAQREIDGVATAALSIVEQRIDDAATQLIKLGLAGVHGCAQTDRDAMRAAEHDAPAVSEIAVIDGSDHALCGDTGAARAVRRISPDHDTLRPEVTLSAVAIGSVSTSKMVRLQWRYPDRGGLRALIPGDALFPHFLRGQTMSGFVAQVVMMNGGVVARTLTSDALLEPDAAPMLAVGSEVMSRRYPIRVDIRAPGSALISANLSLFAYANLGGLAFGLVVSMIALLAGRRSGGPIREIADGIRKGQFAPYYQPVIDITSGRILGCEVLVRWIKPDGRVISPGAFITLAEASGEIFPMTVAVMERARDDLAETYAGRPNLKLGFNLFAGHFDDLTVVDDVKRIFGTSPIGISQLMFEVTERQALPNVARARLVIAKLQSLGARVALDDVGTGHGGLSYLLKLGVDVMKMDKMFVDAIGTDRYSVAIVDSLVKLADDMNLDLIAEGVETIEQVEYLRGKGVRQAQGYVFAPPLPAASFKSLVEAMAPVGVRESRAKRPDQSAKTPLLKASA